MLCISPRLHQVFLFLQVLFDTPFPLPSPCHVSHPHPPPSLLPFRSRGRGRPGRVRSPIRNSNSPARRGGSPPAGTVVVVRNLTRNTNTEHIREIFSHYGELRSVKLDVDERSKLRCMSSPSLSTSIILTCCPSSAWELHGSNMQTARLAKPPSTTLTAAMWTEIWFLSKLV
jgi:hypothetical protein